MTAYSFFHKKYHPDIQLSIFRHINQTIPKTQAHINTKISIASNAVATSIPNMFIKYRSNIIHPQSMHLSLNLRKPNYPHTDSTMYPLNVRANQVFLLSYFLLPS